SVWTSATTTSRCTLRGRSAISRRVGERCAGRVTHRPAGPRGRPLWSSRAGRVRTGAFDVACPPAAPGQPDPATKHKPYRRRRRPPKTLTCTSDVAVERMDDFHDAAHVTDLPIGLRAIRMVVM